MPLILYFIGLALLQSQTKWQSKPDRNIKSTSPQPSTALMIGIQCWFIRAFRVQFFTSRSSHIEFFVWRVCVYHSSWGSWWSIDTSTWFIFTRDHTTRLHWFRQTVYRLLDHISTSGQFKTRHFSCSIFFSRPPPSSVAGSRQLIG